MVRVGYIQARLAITSAMIVTLITPLIEAAMMISTSRAGTVSSVSTAIRIVASTGPPMKPASSPSRIPIIKPIAPARKPTRRVSGRPATTTANRSRPWSSVPNGYSSEGACRGIALSGSACFGSTTSGPSSPMLTIASTRTMPAASWGLRRQ
jgi:hypothetical protein